MLDSVLGVLSNNSGLMVGGGASAMVLWVLKKVPNEHICSVIETACESIGRVMTLGLSKWSVTKNVWNSTIIFRRLDKLEDNAHPPLFEKDQGNKIHKRLEDLETTKFVDKFPQMKNYEGTD